jgi:glycosyltransferase involved in cell wall biosynthesis
VLKALLEADVGARLLAVGGRRPFAAAPADGVRRYPTELSLFGRGPRFVSPASELLRPLARRALAQLARRPDVRRIVCVFPDAFYSEAALFAARRSGKPIRFWFHNTYARNRRGAAAFRARRLEAAMVGAAERVYFISDALKERFLEMHPGLEDRAEVVCHPVTASGARPRGFQSAPVRASLIGNLNASNLDAAARMLRALSPLDGVRIRVCTPVPRRLLAWRGVDLGRVEYLGYLAEDALARLMADTDLFLLPHGLTGEYSADEYATIFPTRAAHYLSYARPILAHCPPGSGLQRFLEAHRCAVCVTGPDESALVAAFEALRSDEPGQAALALQAASVASRFDPRGVLAALLRD